MSLKIRNEQIFQATCLQIPYDLKLAAKESGINLTQTLVKALEVRLKECTGGSSSASKSSPVHRHPTSEGGGQ